MVPELNNVVGTSAFYVIAVVVVAVVEVSLEQPTTASNVANVNNVFFICFSFNLLVPLTSLIN